MILVLHFISPDKVLIHDVARPAVSEDTITDIILEINKETGAAPGLPISDALWEISDGEVQKTLNRDFIFRAQTPLQMIRLFLADFLGTVQLQ